MISYAEKLSTFSKYDFSDITKMLRTVVSFKKCGFIKFNSINFGGLYQRSRSNKQFWGHLVCGQRLYLPVYQLLQLGNSLYCICCFFFCFSLSNTGVRLFLNIALLYHFINALSFFYQNRCNNAPARNGTRWELVTCQYMPLKITQT